MDDQIQAEYESRHPLPANTVRCGGRYAATEYGAWRSHDYATRFEGFRAGWQAALTQQPVPVAAQALAGQHPDDAAVDRFAAAMKVKLSAARTKGRGGWDDPAQCCVESLAVLLVSHLDKGNAGTFEDIANFAMMLHQRGADPRVLADLVAQEQNPWIPVSERLPEADQYVLLCTEFGGRAGDWRYSVGALDSTLLNDRIKGPWFVKGGSWTPSHWMPLPAARRPPRRARTMSDKSKQVSALDDFELEDMAHSALQEGLSFGVNLDVFMRFAKRIASAALSQRPAPAAVPDGWKLVPIEPTPEMIDVALRWGTKRSEWAELLSAAPAPAAPAPAPAAQEPAVSLPSDVRTLLEELQWQHRDYDDYYHKPAGHYCPDCGAAQEKGHLDCCEIARVLAPPAAEQPDTVPVPRALQANDRVPDDFRNQASGYRAGWNDCLAALLARRAYEPA